MFAAVKNIINPIQDSLRDGVRDRWWRESLDFGALHEILRSELTAANTKLKACYDLGCTSRVNFGAVQRELSIDSGRNFEIYKAPDLSERGWVERLLTSKRYFLFADRPERTPGVLNTGFEKAPVRWIGTFDARNCCYAKLDFSGRAALVSEKHFRFLHALGFSCRPSSGPSNLKFLDHLAIPGKDEDLGEFGFGGDWWKQ